MSASRNEYVTQHMVKDSASDSNTMRRKLVSPQII